jgi:hypothetical protein
MGLAIMVAPLTSALMSSVPPQNSGVASAINNAISRVGSPLVTALIFVAVVSSFYGAIASRVPDLDTGSPEFRSVVAPLNPPEQGADPRVVEAARAASTDSFQLAMVVAAGLLLVGAAVNGIGIQNRPRARQEAGGAEAAEPPSPTADGQAPSAQRVEVGSASRTGTGSAASKTPAAARSSTATKSKARSAGGAKSQAASGAKSSATAKRTAKATSKRAGTRSKRSTSKAAAAGRAAKRKSTRRST